MIGFARTAGILLLGTLLVLLAVANRHAVAVAMNPFAPADAGWRFELPLSMVILAALMFGVALAGLAAGREGNRRRRALREATEEIDRLRARIAEMRTPLAAALATHPLHNRRAIADRIGPPEVPTARLLPQLRSDVPQGPARPTPDPAAAQLIRPAHAGTAVSTD